MTEVPNTRFAVAAQDFQMARQRADLEVIGARLTGKSADLLSFDDVRRRLKASADAGIRELRVIPLDAIVGSVGRYSDFTRNFLPRHESDRSRWAGVSAAFASPKGVPPIHVFQIGDAYFVIDGNHRVSVARSLQMDEIEAYVTPLKIRVPLTPDASLDDLIIMEEYADFLERTNLDESHPTVEFKMTEPGRYAELLELIEVHRYMMEQAEQREVSLEEAAAAWCDEVYIPLVNLIRERGILRDFPGRTESDLCVWLARHRDYLSENVGWAVPTEAAAEDLVARHSPKRVVRRLRDKLRDAVVPSPLTSGPPTGKWREERQTADVKRLFREILVPVSGEEEGWRALEQALVVAKREGGEVHGIYISTNPTEATKEQTLQAEFQSRCQRAALPGTLHIQSGGTIAEVIRERGQWNDLMVLRLAHPPGSQPIDRLRSGFSHLIRTTSRPILAVPGEVSPLERPLLAYDGSRKAQEALFIATYLAGCWQIPLTVVTVSDGRRNRAVSQARRYLEEQGIQADFIELQKRNETVGNHILHTAWARQSDVIIMGGYGSAPMIEIALGSSVDTVLRHCTIPILICR
jgi:nucleotide-binding universal stress UspA family protein